MTIEGEGLNPLSGQMQPKDGNFSYSLILSQLTDVKPSEITITFTSGQGEGAVEVEEKLTVEFE